MDGFGCRVLRLIDNQMVASVITKVRSSSFRLKRAIEKLSSLVVASELRLVIGCVATDDGQNA